MGESFDPYLKWFGVPLKDHPIHHYRLLGIEVFEWDVEVIENAADQRMAHLRLHHGQHACGRELLNEVAAARICLLDTPTKKAKYDEELHGTSQARVRRAIRRGLARRDLPRAAGTPAVARAVARAVGRAVARARKRLVPQPV